ncbi:MAG: hypothetical protein KTR29_08045 [Rhodothermaceae bacterium]|nr:hypothetical protein [Rhodothermaceae bacterium]
MKNLFLMLLIFLLASCTAEKGQKSISISVLDSQKAELSYALSKLEARLTQQGMSLNYVNDENADLVVQRTTEPMSHDGEVNDGFNLVKSKGKFALSASHTRGLIYGLLHISQSIEQGHTWDEINEKSVSSHYPFRAIKFNLPWYSYRSGENLSLHYETARDLPFWESFLNMMVENKFNTLTLWNLHPYMFMVQSTSFPESSPFTDEEMADWKSFWQSLFKMAKDRGIDTYMVNWNIFVSDEFSKAYNIADYSKSSGFWGDGESNELIEQYTREMVTKTIDEYPNLTGIGLTLGERMGGMTSEERRNWIDRTIIAGLKSANRKARLIYRAPLSAGTTSHGTVSVSTERLTRNTIETMGLDENVWIEFKFNWSHAHSAPKVQIVHGGMLTDTYWEPLSDKYKGVWTMRNEDFFVMRWAQPDFIRAFIKHNSQPYIGGAIIGSETYIPAKDYITKEEHRTWDYAFERQWLFYKVWGNLLYDNDLPDEYFAESLARKFDLDDGSDLLKAWKLSSMNANRFASFFRGTWDATLYTEGFTSIGGKFIDLNQLIAHPVLDSSFVNIKEYVDGKFDTDQITPLQLADLTEQESQSALSIVAEIEQSDASNELMIELTDIKFWAEYGLYYAEKIRGGVGLQSFRTNGTSEDQEASIEALENALDHWNTMVVLAERYNRPVIPYQFDQSFSWRKNIPQAEYDITIARENIVSDKQIDLR